MTAMLFSLGYEGTGKTPEPEVGRPEVVMVRVKKRRARQEPSPKTRKMSRLTETGSSATGTGCSATDDVSNDDVSKLFSFRHIYPITAHSLFSLPPSLLT